jgi:hypothetical protein
MVITFTLTGLVLLLVAILVATFYFNQEGFAEMEKKVVQKKEGFEDKKKEEKKPEGFEDQPDQEEDEDRLLGTEGFADIAPVASPGLVTAAPASMGPSQNVATASSAPAPAGIRPPVSPTKVEVTDQGYASMEKNQRSALLRDIQKVIRNELIANRATEHVKKGCDDDDEEECDSDHGDSTANAQGRDYKKNSFKKEEDACATGGGSCGPLKDMTKYIRKDEIPCWGCNIDY